MRVNLIYLKEISYQFLNHSSKSLNISASLDEICSYCFHSTMKLYVDAQQWCRQLCSQLSCFIRDAEKRINTRCSTVKKVLMETETFLFHSRTVEVVNSSNEFSSINLEIYQYADSSENRCCFLVESFFGKEFVRNFIIHLRKNVTIYSVLCALRNGLSFINSARNKLFMSVDVLTNFVNESLVLRLLAETLCTSSLFLLILVD